jgi:pimeloyl-ACP methyl ester carboxylesterase
MTRAMLAHPYAASGLSHDYLVSLADLAESAPSIPVIFYDQIGTGRSTLHNGAPASAKDKSFWTIELHIQELLNLVTHLKIADSYDLYGHSWGGILSMELAVRMHPAGLRHLVLANTLASMALWNESVGQRVQALGLEDTEAHGRIVAGPQVDVEAYWAGMGVLYARYGLRVTSGAAQEHFQRSMEFHKTSAVSEAMFVCPAHGFTRI